MTWVLILAQILGPVILELFRAWMKKHQDRSREQKREARKVFYAVCKSHVRRKKGAAKTVQAHGAELPAYELTSSNDEVLADLKAMVEAA